MYEEPMEHGSLIVLLTLNRIASLKLTKNSHPLVNPGTTAQKDRAVDVSGSKLAPPRPEFLATILYYPGFKKPAPAGAWRCSLSRTRFLV